ncbi:hypothetical protein BZA70DRAFT_265100 [Myxozyma melibiosi]|uniref:holo-[acyl-carrier-protein] synthase n=1 Tax=Myxozyma melibiosi TaxID=54550 RepID=A0ABR1FD28_9ASCO
MVVVHWIDLKNTWTEPADPSFLHSLSCIPPSERVAVSKFHFRRDASTHLASLILQHSTIARLANIPYPKTHIRRSEHGRPYPSIINPPFDYNVSHHGSCVAIGVRDSPPLRIGIDLVDLSSAGPADVNDFRDVFAPQECSAISRSHSPRVLFSYWALKEAYTKALGLGLVTENLQSIVFSNVPPIDFSSNPYSAAITCSVDNIPLNWRFELFALSESLLLAVATPADNLEFDKPTSVSRITLSDLLQLAQPFPHDH